MTSGSHADVLCECPLIFLRHAILFALATKKYYKKFIHVIMKDFHLKQNIHLQNFVGLNVHIFMHQARMLINVHRF